MPDNRDYSDCEGLRYRCKKDPQHPARLIKDSAGRFWLKVEAWAYCWTKKLSPTGRCDFFKNRVGLYLVCRGAMLVLACSLVT